MLSYLTCYIKNHPDSLFKAPADSFFEKSAMKIAPSYTPNGVSSFPNYLRVQFYF